MVIWFCSEDVQSKYLRDILRDHFSEFEHIGRNLAGIRSVFEGQRWLGLGLEHKQTRHVRFLASV
jgi:hypothetical protein